MGKESFPSPRFRAVRLVRDADALQEIVTSWIALENLGWRVMVQTDTSRINDQWRICVVWRAGDAYAVEITDDH